MSERYEERGSGTLSGAVDWSRAPYWARFYARDKNGGHGKGWWFEDRPRFTQNGAWVPLYGTCQQAPVYGPDDAWGLVERETATENADG